tara:strand:- start:478 stop:729 length:252 start_codon:yes stop_codon:yes gene_type:complete
MKNNPLENKIISSLNKSLNIQINEENKSEISIEKIQLWDSLNHINVIIGLEMEFNIEIDSGDAMRMVDLNEIENILSEKYNIK